MFRMPKALAWFNPQHSIIAGVVGMLVIPALGSWRQEASP